ncbi:MULTISPECIES: tRNA preQ1(34) S-adenosylmethionine ribosyltransferase-isomerase QueA [Ruminococcus]|uniref:S-adenosylmethionine:tRNA ribosyltransferase-isomerase n=1 Tax=Ruminococcus bovis TaxID=2564099 RepID=A0A4P8Y2Z9_9FIRM|nr:MULTISPECIES: tRNA preQ1(34) S-adenosylmethionine ribosyltransferase-isomerase QueA [Ruminococcus]MEE3439097.1 tRNA preQ1(34) S-adenosylmethionine ribosyltransferase-isomerase QueA [Ruminococcus sp.]QCT07698.1 tRNA preQ1(34) S-adenosylmethionine ribosyltransferase-isomerase QueA [Ruminococcus bovis]
MKTSDFYYDLPEELIAQTPVEPRDSSRMMVYNRKTKEVLHKHFYDVIDFLNEGDALIVNDSRVLPARIYGTKIPTGANVEFLLLKQVKDKVWETLVKPGKKARTGDSFTFGDGIMTGKVIDVLEDGNRIVEFKCDSNFYETLDKIGQMPLPPYIHEKLKDKERYQTVYSHELGSAAAPTAGLHFTDELLEKIKAKGIKIGYVTLHVGLGTFRPVKVDDVTTHKMHSEHYEVPEETAKLIEETKKNGKRVIAVGTTSCRTLESVAKEHGKVVPCEGWTDIFIYPGFEFKVLDGLITNFHLPESTLIMLVSAFAGYDEVMGIYKEAVKEKYRFFSFGDSMFIE